MTSHTKKNKIKNNVSKKKYIYYGIIYYIHTLLGILDKNNDFYLYRFPYYRLLK